MASKNSLFSRGWCETIFEGKNKEFGAYALRRDSNKRHRKALALVVASISLAALLPAVLSKVLVNEPQEKMEVVNLSQIKLEMDDISDMPNEPIRAEDIPHSGEKEVTVAAPSQTMGGLVVAPDGDKADIGTESKEVSGEPSSWESNPKSFSEKKEEQANEDAILTAPDEMPKFDGRDAIEAFRQYVIKQLRYPENLENQHVEGTVYVQFVVERSGSLSNIKVLRGVHQDIDNEVVRVIQGSPAWTPGKQRGKLVRVAYTFPIVFQID